jgi:hypothetical protein
LKWVEIGVGFYFFSVLGWFLVKKTFCSLPVYPYSVTSNDGIVQKFEAPKPKGSSCIVNKGGEVIPLTDKNSIYDSEDGTLIVTQTTTSIPAGVSIEYEQISKKK